MRTHGRRASYPLTQQQGLLIQRSGDRGTTVTRIGEQWVLRFASGNTLDATALAEQLLALGYAEVETDRGTITLRATLLGRSALHAFMCKAG
jgi:hypothetical protein